jgi:hypothetical protein
MGSNLDPLFDDVLRKLQDLRPAIIARKEADVSVEFNMQRPLCRGSKTQTGNKRIPADVVTFSNRWRAQERAVGRRPKFQMMEYYTNVRVWRCPL